MPRYLMFAAFAFLASACGKPAGEGALALEAPAADAAPTATGAPAVPSNFVLACAPPFTPDATAATLAAAFGAENVIPETIEGPEGDKLNVTAVYPNDPGRRIEVYFKEEEARTGLLSAIVKESASTWTGPGGIRMGDGVEKVEAANGGPFMIGGFDWDYGGFASDWKGGKLKETVPGCHTVMRFKRDPDNQDLSIVGEVERSSDLPAMRAAKPTVSEFGISW